MGLSRDFDRVTIDDNDAIRVEATTLDEAGKPSSPDPATRMYIMLVGLPDEDVMLTAQPAEMPIVDSSWAVLFEDAAPQFEGVSDVLCIGVALTADGPPEVWTEQRPLQRKS
jgi:hypothetical protein